MHNPFCGMFFMCAPHVVTIGSPASLTFSMVSPPVLAPVGGPLHLRVPGGNQLYTRTAPELYTICPTMPPAQTQQRLPIIVPF